MRLNDIPPGMGKTRFTFAQYRVTVKHDKGVTRLTVPAQSREAAAESVMRSELCPRSAIKFIERLA